jgi:hypothetical protein
VNVGHLIYIESMCLLNFIKHVAVNVFCLRLLFIGESSAPGILVEFLMGDLRDR